MVNILNGMKMDKNMLSVNMQIIKKNGNCTIWCYGSEQYTEGNYLNDQRNGVWTDYWSKGIKEAEVQYKNGNKNGKVLGWYSNGSKHSEGTFLDDKKIGWWTYWNSDGQIIYTINFSDSISISTFYLS